MTPRRPVAKPQVLRLFALACALAASLQYLGLAQVGITGVPTLTAPKRPLSGYFIFVGEKRASYVAEHPGEKMIDVSKAMGQLWKELSDEDKAPFQKQAEEAKQRYAAELQEFLDAGGVLPERKSKKDKKQKRAKPGPAVKRPPSAYILYTMAERPNYVEANPGAKATEVMKALGKSWKELGEDEKQKFVQQAEEAKEKYKEQLEALKAAGESEEESEEA